MNGGLLAPLRVLDLGGAESDGVGRLLADLGADVLKIEPPGGSSARDALPLIDGASIAFTVNNANKRSAVLDPNNAADRARLTELASAADIVVDGGNPAGAARLRNVVCGTRRTVRSSGGVVGHRLRFRGSIRVEAGHRRRAVCDVDGAVADRADSR